MRLSQTLIHAGILGRPVCEERQGLSLEPQVRRSQITMDPIDQILQRRAISNSTPTRGWKAIVNAIFNS